MRFKVSYFNFDNVQYSTEDSYSLFCGNLFFQREEHALRSIEYHFNQNKFKNLRIATTEIF